MWITGIWNDRVSTKERIDGWKAIAAYFGRDRTTAMRWAQTRGLPVRRIPGGKTATVYALKAELDDWALRHDEADEGPPTAPAEDRSWKAQSAPGSRRQWLMALGGGLVLATGFATYRAVSNGGGAGTDPRGEHLPANQALADRYIQARDDWARRTPESLAKAIDGLETVTRRDPGYAPAFAALADSYLLAREFGSMGDVEAFGRAKDAAETSLRLDPGLADAHRAMGFVQYWWLNDPPRAGRSFRTAVELAPQKAQTHFWYGNVLSDNGRHEAALRELNQARLLEPGSVAIQTDLAWAQWAAGQDAAARTSLEGLIRSSPEFAVAHESLAVIKLAAGDYAGYLAAFETYARLRNDATQQADARAMRAALEQGVPVLQKQMLDRAMQRVGAERTDDHAWPAFLAATAGDRAKLLEILHIARTRRERWGAAGTTTRIRSRYADDAEVIGLLDEVRPEPAE